MKIIFANWKSYKSLQQAKHWIEQVAENIPQNIKNSTQYEIIIGPAFSLLETLNREIQLTNLNFQLAVQDLSPYGVGAYTGAICAKNLEHLNIRYALLGHSERRRFFAETDKLVAKKVIQAAENSLKSIVCIDQGYIKSQAEVIRDENLSVPLVAYEPLSAISSTPGAKNADPSQVETIVNEIKSEFVNSKVIYGGSVDASNVMKYLEISDGVLIGSASLEPQKFCDILSQLK